MTIISIWIFILSLLGMLFAASFNAPRWVYRIPAWTGLISFLTALAGVSIWMWNVMP